MARVVLGIDAAWTNKQPSGVAVVSEMEVGWRVVATAPSYEQFYDFEENLSKGRRPVGSVPDVTKLLATSQNLCKQSVDLVAIDMPIANSEIVGRRESDNAISRVYGSRKCSTHSPSPDRPGIISDKLKQAFGDQGYALQTSGQPSKGLVEVYPHPALVEMLGAPERLPYKHSKSRKYWPDNSPSERRLLLIAEWRRIERRLDAVLHGTSKALPVVSVHSTAWELKAFEDVLDAIVCAWVGVCILDRRAVHFGDEDSAIWVPKRCENKTV